jgi:hypothetical protein
MGSLRIRILLSIFFGMSAPITVLGVHGVEVTGGAPESCASSGNSVSAAALGVVSETEIPLRAAGGPALRVSLADRLSAKGFKCSPTSSATVKQCHGRLEGYTQPVAVLVSDRFDASKPAQEIFHFHGLNPSRTLQQIVDEPLYGFTSNLEKSDANTILVIPYDQGDLLQFKSQLTRPENVERLFADLRRRTEISKSKSLSLTAHSAGGGPMSTLLKNLNRNSPLGLAPLKKIGIFDALYGEDKFIHEYAMAHPDVSITQVMSNSYRSSLALSDAMIKADRRKQINSFDYDKVVPPAPELKGKPRKPTMAEHEHSVTVGFQLMQNPRSTQAKPREETLRKPSK